MAKQIDTTGSLDAYHTIHSALVDMQEFTSVRVDGREVMRRGGDVYQVSGRPGERFDAHRATAVLMNRG